MLTNTEFCNFHHPLPWKQSNMATKQIQLLEVCVKGIVCLTNMIAEIDTDAHYVYFVRRILSYVAFCIFNKFSFNIYKNSAFFPQLKHHKTFFFYYYQILLTKLKITIHTSTMQSCIALTLFKAEQTSVAVKAHIADFHQNCSKQRQPQICKQPLLTIYT